MSSFLSNLEQGLFTPKGDMGDYQHAAKLYNANFYAFSPKVKFLYHVAFQINPNAYQSSGYTHDINNVVGMLVKSVDLPKYKITVETVNQYNRKKQLQTKLEYDPITITFHDDNSGATTSLWQLYFQHYFADSKNSQMNDSSVLSTNASAYSIRPPNFKYGLDNNVTIPFFKSIDIYQLSRHQWFMYSLVNPLVTTWQHDNLDNSSSEIVQNAMSVSYETVIMNSGMISQDHPPVFATQHYDHSPSPLGLSGGGSNMLLGSNGLIGGSAGLLASIASGSAFTNPVGTLVQGMNLANNIQNLSTASLQTQGFNFLTSSLGSVGNINVSGVANTLFPSSNLTGQNQSVAAQPTVNSPASTTYSSSIQNAASTFTNNFTANPAAYANAVTTIARTANIPGIPVTVLAFNNLSVSAQTSAVDSIVQQYQNGNAKVIGLVNQYVQLGS